MSLRSELVPPDAIRTLFSTAMSRMYQAEVPQYGALVSLVATINAETRRARPELDRKLVSSGEADRLELERHGAIRVGSARELSILRRLFAVMGMEPVGYYDLSIAGVPVHSTAFRPVSAVALRRNPFRVFTSLLRPELIPDAEVRQEAEAILARRTIFTPGCLAFIDAAEREGGLRATEAERFVAEALETFRWHRQATVALETYARLQAMNPVVADVVCFKGPHINHLTPRALDIEAVQAAMIKQGLPAKAVIEGPPQRNVPILLRQTSFKALSEPVSFRGPDGTSVLGAHTARFGEVEQRGVALTPAGRSLYDRLLAESHAASDISDPASYGRTLERTFAAFPDTEAELRRRGLAYFRYSLTGDPLAGDAPDLEGQIARGEVQAEPITYEDFLPVSAAGIFRSNLGHTEHDVLAQGDNKPAFEEALGREVVDPFVLYAAEEEASKLSIQRARGMPGRIVAGLAGL